MPVNISKVKKNYGGKPVLKELSLEIEDGEFISLIGPSGVGKTTLLRILANIETPDSGEVHFSRTPGKEDPVIMVFQDFALFPHMTVAENVGYGLKMRGVRRKDRQERVEKMLDWFGIADKAPSYPARLSAGQRQRAAIARALVVEPMVLLLDEPFANLDKNLKGETARFIRQTQRSFGITTVMVTHDQEEAFAVSDRIGVLISGELRQYSSPEELLKSPADGETERFLGMQEFGDSGGSPSSPIQLSGS
ncbi:MAG: ABC transporter ATP-binding protein [Spirochaetales bacterium]|nr:ABC transporter ATP-binding protein [Spirochaetales bacterium]